MMTYKPSKLSQTDLFYGLLSEFVSRSVHAATSAAIMIYATVVNAHINNTDRQLLTS